LGIYRSFSRKRRPLGEKKVKRKEKKDSGYCNGLDKWVHWGLGETRKPIPQGGKARVGGGTGKREASGKMGPLGEFFLKERGGGVLVLL